MLAEMIKGPLAEVEDIVFAVRATGGDGHWYANFGYWSSDENRMMYGRDGGRLVRLNLRSGRTADILADPGGSVRDPCVHYDGRRILFSYRKAGSRWFHLYEIQGDGTGLRQLTDGPWDDLEPIYLPDGDLLFASSRCKRWVQCWFTHVATLHRAGPDGRNIRPASANVEQDNTPWLLPDGRVLYMRWEYVDRSRVRYHHLWTMNPDGTGQMVYFGNMYGGTVMLDAKPIPGTGKVVSIFSPGHGQKEHAGSVVIVDPDGGPDERSRVRPVSSRGGWRDPWAFSEKCFLAAQDAILVLMDGQGRSETLYTLAGEDRAFWVHEPRPLAPRPREPIIAPAFKPAQATGRLVLADVLHGRNMDGVGRGEIRKLLVLETLPKPVNHSGTMEPTSLGGTFTLPRILGTVPVEPDGSAYFEVPALRPLFFVALDERDRSVKRMQSFLTVMPGETVGCAGCHENRAEAPLSVPRRALAALARRPSPIEPIPDVPDVLDFPRDVQPILDRRCLGCHDDDKRCGGVVLSGDRGPIYSHAYCTILSRNLVTHGHDADGNRPPRSIGSSSSPLMQKLDGSHHEVRPTPTEVRTIRLWIESGVPYAGTYAALGTGMVRASADGGVLKRRCSGCHKSIAAHPELQVNLTRPEKSLVLLAPLAKEAGGLGLCKSQRRTVRNPPKEPIPAPKPAGPAIFEPPAPDGGIAHALLARLKEPPRAAKAPDGPAVTVETTGAVFADASDPDYQRLLEGIRAAKAQLDQVKRFDMPDFRPSPYYVREMKRFGVLPADLDPEAARVDVYATDRAYWRSLWYDPSVP